MIRHQKDNSRGNYNYNAYTYFNANWSPHFHTNLELIYVLDGFLEVTVNGKREAMSRGDFALILPGQIHSFETNDHSNIWIAVFSEQFVSLFVKRIEGQEGNGSVFRCDDATHDFILRNLVLAESSVVMKKACFYAVCDQYQKSIPLVQHKRRNNDIVCRLLDYVAEHYTEDLSLADVATVFGYEYHYLSRLLNQGYQINFSHLVNEYRIDKAIQLLQSTDKPVTEIALESGFGSVRNFNYAFKAVTKVSPKRYTKQK